MPKSLFAKMQPSCGYCRYGKFSDCGDMILCMKKGVVSVNYSCRRFCYNPLARIPHRPAALPDFDKEDFDLQAEPENAADGRI